MLWEFGTNSVQLRERKNGFLVPKRHWMKHLDFLSFLLESRRSMSPKGIEEVGSIPTAEVEIDNPVFFPPSLCHTYSRKAVISAAIL